VLKLVAHASCHHRDIAVRSDRHSVEINVLGRVRVGQSARVWELVIGNDLVARRKPNRTGATVRAQMLHDVQPRARPIQAGVRERCIPLAAQSAGVDHA
jgi:hypothetical protein